MAIYHIVLFKLKPSVQAAQLKTFETTVYNMLGKVPGLQKINFGAPHVSTAHRAQGYNVGVVAILDKPETIKVYAEHPAHLEVVKLREELCSDALAYDLEFTP